MKEDKGKPDKSPEQGQGKVEEELPWYTRLWNWIKSLF